MAALFAGVPAHEAECILYDNAADVFGFDVARLEERAAAAASA